LAKGEPSKGNKQVIVTMKALFDKLYAKIEMDVDSEPAPAEHEDATPENTVPEPVEPVEAPVVVENHHDAKADDKAQDEDTEMLL
jgi:hypothetical protein